MSTSCICVTGGDRDKEDIAGCRGVVQLGGPTKVKAYKSFLFTDGSLKVENNRSIHL